MAKQQKQIRTVNKTKTIIEKPKKICQKCFGLGYCMDRDKTVHTCWDCLRKGKL